MLMGPAGLGRLGEGVSWGLLGLGFTGGYWG